ncbi:MAG: DUF512 domain-containing protein, partial [FCB group bacterium]|nr:DUF512 domain-containing protein [FCB group bacterium]
FIHQQPKGMRRALYIKDDDYRYSFTHGNFITLSEMSDADFDRIIDQRLSPLYISVHATDDSLRRCIFRNEKLEPIMPRLRQLVDHGIALQTQTVVCPGINDGEYLDKTITDLADLAVPDSYGGVESLAVVPVGLTRYRKKLPGLRIYTKAEAGQVIDQVEAYHSKYLNELGTRFAFPADEFFLMAERKLPSLGYYEEMLQFENGVGMARQFIVDFNRRRRYLPMRVKKTLKLGLVTGRSAEPFMRRHVLPALNGIERMKAELIVVDNRFWGEMVTVTGLLTGGDILEDVRKSDADMVFLPPNCLNTDDLFLDDLSLDRFKHASGRPVLCGSYNLVSLVKQSAALWEN